MPLVTGADKIYLGQTEADRVYLGSQLIWEPEEIPGADIASLFTGGQAGMVFLPGTEWTDCYVEATGSPPATKCTHGTSVGTIHDKVRNTYTRITTSNQRPTYQIVNGKHFLKFNGVPNSMPLTGNSNVNVTAVDAVFGININNDNAGILLVAGGDDYLGVWYQWWNSSELASRTGVGTIPVSIQVNSDFGTINTREDLYNALAGANRVVTVSAQQPFGSTQWQTGSYPVGDEYGHEASLYGLIVRFSAPLTEAERELAQNIMAEHLGA